MSDLRTVSDQQLSMSAELLQRLIERRRGARSHTADLIRFIDQGDYQLIGRITGSGSNLTPTERAAEARLRVTRRMDDVEAHCVMIVTAINDATHDCDKINRTRTRIKPRCDSGIGREGYNIPREDGGWSDPNCENIPDEGEKICGACRLREYRWRRRMQLPPRERTPRTAA